jgi:hypothetical protein
MTPATERGSARRRVAARLLALAAAFALGLRADAAEAPPGIRATLQGLLLGADDGPVSGQVGLRVRVHAGATPFPGPETALYESPVYDTAIANGFYSIDFGPVPLTAFEDRSTVWVALLVEGDAELAPRLAWDAPLLARRVRAAASAEGGAHCQCEKVAPVGGATACPAGKLLAGVYSECSGGQPCVSALHCCRLCD